VSELLPENFLGIVTIPNEKISMLNKYLFFQCDYWGVYRFIGEDDLVYEFEDLSFSFTNTGIHFENWVLEKMEQWNEPESKQNT
jgi:hypothetical protein